MQTKFVGDIESIRAVEDCIRATKKYTKGAFSPPVRHPIQGESFPSKVLSEYYEVYPEMEISWNMPVNKAIDWMFSNTPCINMVFYYDYRNNSARVTVKDGNGAIKELMDNIPGIKEALGKTEEKSNNHDR